VDARGRSIKSRRIRAVHAETSQLPGTSGWFIRRDPFLAYQAGTEPELPRVPRA
jgi:hypothetical protein